MSLSVTIGILLSVASLSTLVFGDLLSVLTVTSAKITNTPNDYFDPWSIDIIKTKKNSLVTIKIPTKKELPPTMQMKLVLGMRGQDAYVYEVPVCDAMSDPVIGANFVKAGTPSDTFPKECPFVPGDWTILKWNPPTEKIIPGIPDGPFTGTITFMEEGKPPYVQIDIEAQLSHSLLGFGR